MPNNFDKPVYYHLIRDREPGDCYSDLKKIVDYLLTFVGEIAVKTDSKGSAVISYTDSPLTATLKTKNKLDRQITLTCEDSDSVSINLIKNVIGNIGYRVFNQQTLSYLVNDPAILDLTMATVDPKIAKIIKKYGLTPLFRYRDSLVFFAKDKKGKMHLINRHLLEYLSENPSKILSKDMFSVVVAKDIGTFVALFDRGLIPLSFFKADGSKQNILNLSGMNINKISQNLRVELIHFSLDLPGQTFIQGESQKLDIKKGKSLTKALKLENYLAVKIPQDISYEKKGKTLIPNLRISVFLDS
jgi:hypothetical protein